MQPPLLTMKKNICSVMISKYGEKCQLCPIDLITAHAWWEDIYRCCWCAHLHVSFFCYAFVHLHSHVSVFFSVCPRVCDWASLECCGARALLLRLVFDQLAPWVKLSKFAKCYLKLSIQRRSAKPQHEKSVCEACPTGMQNTSDGHHSVTMQI